MKRYQLLLVAVLTTTVLYGSAAAEYQDDKIFGNGRFLRRLRGETEKSPSAKSKDGKGSAKASKVDPRAKTPTLAGKRPTKVPTPAANRPTRNTPTPAARTGFAPQPTTGSNSATRSKTPRSFADAAKSVFEPKSGAQPSQSEKSASLPKSGFGMELDMRSDQFVVTKIDPRGNAHNAGLQKGDMILEAGGIELTSMEEFNEIAKILGEGDQLEFKIERRGKKQDLLIQYGTTPTVDANPGSSVTNQENSFSSKALRDENSKAAKGTFKD